MAVLLALQALSQLLSALDVLRQKGARDEGQLALAMFVAVCAILFLASVALTLGGTAWASPRSAFLSGI